MFPQNSSEILEQLYGNEMKENDFAFVVLMMVMKGYANIYH